MAAPDLLSRSRRSGGKQPGVSAACRLSFLHQDFNFGAVLRDRELSRQSSDQGRRPTYPLSLHHAWHSAESLDYEALEGWTCPD